MAQCSVLDPSLSLHISVLFYHARQELMKRLTIFTVTQLLSPTGLLDKRAFFIADTGY